ncbi:MAG: rRNA methyltransferase RsmB/F, partial [Bacteroidota bacterium]
LFAVENEGQVQKFLARHPEFTLEEEKYIYPSEHDSDGFFMTRLLKKK